MLALRQSNTNDESKFGKKNNITRELTPSQQSNSQSRLLNNSILRNSANKSTMLDQEMKAIQKIKEKQKKEIEHLVEYEMKMKAI